MPQPRLFQKRQHFAPIAEAQLGFVDQPALGTFHEKGDAGAGGNGVHAHAIAYAGGFQHDVAIAGLRRQPLGVYGELVWRVPSLQLPSLKPLPTLDELAQYEAVRLFVNTEEMSARSVARERLRDLHQNELLWFF